MLEGSNIVVEVFFLSTTVIANKTKRRLKSQ